MTKDYMLTVYSPAHGARDVQVNNAENMHVAIALAEKETGCRVDHGRSGILPLFDPGIMIDAKTGRVGVIHERPAEASMQLVAGPKMSVPRGEGKR